MTAEVTPEGITQQLIDKGIISAEPEAKSEDSSKMEHPEQAVEAAEPLSIEDQARAVGWRPDGPESAEIFLATKPLWTEIKTRGKKLKELDATIKELSEHFKKVEETTYKKALAELQAERRAAISMGDVKAVEQLDEAMEQIKPAKVESAAEVAAKAFVDRNQSWIKDPSMEAEEIRQWVKKRDAELGQFALDPNEHMERLESEMRKVFKMDKDEEEAPKSTSKVESESNSVNVKGRKRVSFNDLSKAQKEACRHFEKRGIMKAEEYIKQLQDLGEI